MKTLPILMLIAIAMVSIGTVTAAIPDADGDLLIGMTTQEFVDYYGAKYLEGDRSKVTVETLDFYAEEYAIYPTMDIYATETVVSVEVVDAPVPTTPVATPVTTPVKAPEPVPTVSEIQPPMDDTGSNTTAIMMVCAILIVGIIAYIFTQQKKED